MYNFRSETSLDSPPEMRRMKSRVESPTPSSYSAADLINNNHLTSQPYENTPPSSKTFVPPPRQQPQKQSSNAPLVMKAENGYYQNPMANLNNNSNNNNHSEVDSSAPNLPPKSKLRYSESTRSTTMSHRDFENNVVNTLTSPQQQQLHSPAAIQVESPLNVTIIQEGSWKPYKEEVKSYEISDFYKYSEKYRQQQQQQQQKSNVN
jgi:hypothetical protein